MNTVLYCAFYLAGIPTLSALVMSISFHPRRNGFECRSPGWRLVPALKHQVIPVGINSSYGYLKIESHPNKLRNYHLALLWLVISLLGVSPQPQQLRWRKARKFLIEKPELITTLSTDLTDLNQDDKISLVFILPLISQICGQSFSKPIQICS